MVTEQARNRRQHARTRVSWPVVIETAVVLMTGVYALDRGLGVDPLEALGDAAVAGLISFVILEYWKG